MNLEFNIGDEIIIINANDRFNGRKGIITEIKIYIMEKTKEIKYKVWFEEQGCWFEDKQVRKVFLTDDECFMIGKNKGVSE
jgi:hypothetical protein